MLQMHQGGDIEPIAGVCMLRILIPVDGSENALRAVRHAVFLAGKGAPIECRLLNVQEPMETGVHAYRTHEEIAQMEFGEAEAALRSARAIFDAAAVPYEAVHMVGDVARVIAGHAQSSRCDCIVMGMRGMGIVVGPLAMGSVTSKVLHAAEVPVTVVK
jgi:nucleotide-binding universal stress UspA family protein